MILVISNIIFLLLGLALTGFASWIASSHFSHFFLANFVNVLFAAGIIIVLVSALGLIGACSQKKRYLTPYLLLVLVCLAVQIGALAQIGALHTGLDSAQALQYNEADYDSATESVMSWVKKNTEHTYNEAQCTLSATPSIGEIITCTSDNSKWFEAFVNTKCSTNVIRCEANTDPAAVTFCLCQNALTDELKHYSNPVLIAAASLVGFELLLLVFVMCLCCIGRHNKQRQPRCSLDERLHQQPQAQFQYAQHTSVPPGARDKVAPGTVDCVAASQAISLV